MGEKGFLKTLKNFIEKIKPKKITFEEIFKKYPLLNVMQPKGKAVEGYALFESIKWQRYYSIAFISLTLILVIITGFYASLVSQSNQIIREQFLSENSPTFYLKTIEGKIKNNTMVFNLEIINIGKGPGRILNILAKTKYGQPFILENFQQRTLILPDEIKPFALLTYNSNFLANDTIEIIINYDGIKENKGKVKNYTEILKINENKNVVITEGNL